MQNHYSLLYREEEREMFPTLKLFGVGSIPWSPLARGLLTRPLTEESKRGNTDWFQGGYKSNPALEEIVKRCVPSRSRLRCRVLSESNRVEKIAKAKGVSMAQIAVAWVLAKDGVSAPIVGTTSLKNLEDILGASPEVTSSPLTCVLIRHVPRIAGIDVKLTEEELKELEEPYQPIKVFGHF